MERVWRKKKHSGKLYRWWHSCQKNLTNAVHPHWCMHAYYILLPLVACTAQAILSMRLHTTQPHRYHRVCQTYALLSQHQHKTAGFLPERLPLASPGCTLGCAWTCLWSVHQCVYQYGKMIASQKFCDGNIQEQCMTYYMITNLALHMQDNIPSTLLVGEWLRQ